MVEFLKDGTVIEEWPEDLDGYYTKLTSDIWTYKRGGYVYNPVFQLMLSRWEGKTLEERYQEEVATRGGRKSSPEWSDSTASSPQHTPRSLLARDSPPTFGGDHTGRKPDHSPSPSIEAEASVSSTSSSSLELSDAAEDFLETPASISPAKMMEESKYDVRPEAKEGKYDAQPGDLPPFERASEVESGDDLEYVHAIKRAYEEVATSFKKNLFSLPSGSTGKAFIAEKIRLLNEFNMRGPLEKYAKKASMVMEALLLQRSNGKSNTKNNKSTLERRLRMWREGRILELLDEARAIQQRMPRKRREMDAEEVTRIFTKLMFEGSVSSALSFLFQNRQGGVQDLTPEVKAKLKAQHPPPEQGPEEVYIQGEPPAVQPIIFEELTAAGIKEAANRTRGSAGPSGGDAEHWKRMLHSFGDKSNELAESMAVSARRMCTEYVDPDSLEALLADRLVPLDKNPGTRPVGIGEVERRIIGKAVVKVLRPDIKRAAGATQLCAGQEGGVEAAIHAMLQVFEHDDTDAVLLVDAQNAFNRLNRRAALHNIRFICPPFAVLLINWYRRPARLFVAGGLEIASEEGTTQGCPCAMQMYALAVLPLIDRLRSTLRGQREEGGARREGSEGVEEQQDPPVQGVQAWYADDSQAAGRLRALRAWWDVLARDGPGYGYHVNADKTYLVVKSRVLEEAKKVFAGTGVHVVDEAHRDLGAAIGELSKTQRYVEGKVEEWTRMVEELARIARVQPHAAYSAYVTGLSQKWTFMQRTMGGISPLFTKLRDAIHRKLIPAIFAEKEATSFGEQFLALLALPHRHGGLKFTDPVVECAEKHSDSRDVTAVLTGLLLASERSLPENYDELVQATKAAVRDARKKREDDRAAALLPQLSDGLQRAVALASEKGGSSVFTVLPLERHGFALKAKRDFHDLVRMRYRMQIRGLPTTYVCLWAAVLP
jgi:hypothetical protein